MIDENNATINRDDSPANTDVIERSELMAKRAAAVIDACGVYEAWESVGAEVHPVGSVPMGLIANHRDVDFHIYTPEISIETSFKAIAKMAEKGSLKSVSYTNLLCTEEQCLEWHAFYTDHLGDDWQIDMIHIVKNSQFDGYFETVARRILAVLTPEIRKTILTLKFSAPEEEHIPGIDFYEAVIEGGVQTWDEFRRWQNERPKNDSYINMWMPQE